MTQRGNVNWTIIGLFTWSLAFSVLAITGAVTVVNSAEHWAQGFAQAFFH